ncbi:uncharacterized protein BDV17DRAFT_296669 [Aspergillus undulatus]|uniref:uncharacterized protein n=1 Tax=Aspergillus undulatus TaxID=1810928 RepID=UPI003CCE4510
MADAPTAPAEQADHAAHGEPAGGTGPVSPAQRPMLLSPPTTSYPATRALAQYLADQLLQHHGCLEHGGQIPPDPHRMAISELVAIDYPDVLSRPDLKPYPAD